MSGYSITMHPDLPIMMTKFYEDFVFENEALSYTARVKSTLDSQTSPVFYLFDLRDWHRMTFGELVQAASQAARGKDTNFHHPMNRHTLIITNDKLVSMSAEGMQSEAFGNAKIKVFDTPEAAMEFVKSEL